MDSKTYRGSETRPFIGLIALTLAIAACSGDDGYEPTYSQRSATGSECLEGGTVLLIDGVAQVTACNGSQGEMGPSGLMGASGVVGPSGADAEDFQSMTGALEPYAESLVGVACCATADTADPDNLCAFGSGVKTTATRFATAGHLFAEATACFILSEIGEILGTSTAIFPSATGADAAQIEFELDRRPIVPSVLAYRPELGEPVIVVGRPATALGQPVTALGQPVTELPVYENQYTFGHVTATSLAATLNARGGAALWPNAFSIDAVTWHGNSGGAVFNEDGVCIGLLVGGLNGREVNSGPDTAIVLPFPSDS